MKVSESFWSKNNFNRPRKSFHMKKALTVVLVCLIFLSATVSAFSGSGPIKMEDNSTSDNHSNKDPTQQDDSSIKQEKGFLYPISRFFSSIFG